MIKKAGEIKTKDKILVTIKGLPGTGKTTMALSAPKPVIFDCDGKLQKVELEHKAIAGIVQVSSFQEILDDLKSDVIKKYETIIFDTAGALVDFLSAHVVDRDPKLLQADGMSLHLRAWTPIKKLFIKMIDYCRITLQKDVIIVCHIKEDRKNEGYKYYMDVAGGARLFISQKSDLMGMMEMLGKKRVIGFSPTEDYDAKSAYGIKGVIDVPVLGRGQPNVFLTNLFHRIDNHLEAQAKEGDNMMAGYNQIMNTIRTMVKGVTNIKSATKVFEEYQKIDEWPFSSKNEAWTLLQQRAEEVGLKYNHKTKRFEVKKNGK